MDVIQSLVQLLLRFWNEGDVVKVLEFFSEQAVLYDDDGGEVALEKKEIEDYLSIAFEFVKSRGGLSEMKHKVEKMDVEDDCIIESGTYRWLILHEGRYLRKWVQQNNTWRIKAYYFTVENVYAAASTEIHDNKENETPL
uniref:DUF4440 domain-containing protein n=1 Tax=Plectus sambesii TaxID=2011161 RepID=A0A914VVZ8_9BILA